MSREGQPNPLGFATVVYDDEQLRTGGIDCRRQPSDRVGNREGAVAVDHPFGRVRAERDLLCRFRHRGLQTAPVLFDE